MSNRFSNSILFTPLFSLLLGGIFCVSCGDEDNDAETQDSSYNQTANDEQNEWSGTPFDGNDKMYTVNGVTFKMIAIFGGTFTMGFAIQDSARPLHQVTLSNYYIGETEVTQELWNAVMGSNPSKFIGDEQCPVEQVSWNDCQIFLNKLNQLTKENFHLPTEAQWEYAACGGNKAEGYKGSSYSGGEIANVGWYRYNSNNTTHRVKGKAPNELGIYDMTGNVSEWCSDWFGPYTSDEQVDPKGAVSGTSRVERGGSWDSSGGSTSGLVNGCRGCYNPSSMYSDLGLRLAK